MAVVRSLEGTFYDIPDSELEQYKVPADQVKGLMEAAGQKRRRIPGPQQPGREGQGQGQGQGQGGTGGCAADPCPVHNAGRRGRRWPAAPSSRSSLKGRRREAKRRTSSLNGTG